MHALNDNITIVPNGVDTQKFARKNPPDPYTIIFPGNLSYPPNIDAAIRLATKIFPAISKEIPGSRLILCGSSPALPVKKLACENIIVTGWVENIVEYYEKASLMIAPLRLGSGMQNKILESMAMQVPCITTPMVNLSIGAKENEEILLAQTDEDFVEKAILLLKNESLRQKIAQNGYDLVKNQYNWQTKLEKLINIIEHGRS
jgi:glycosyltransferase involved in cell wall biosynthesis